MVVAINGPESGLLCPASCVLYPGSWILYPASCTIFGPLAVLSWAQMYPVALFNESSFPKTFYGFSHLRSVGICVFVSVLMCVCVCVCPGTLAARMQMWRPWREGRGAVAATCDVRRQLTACLFVCLSPGRKEAQIYENPPSPQTLEKSHLKIAINFGKVVVFYIIIL